MAQKEAAKKCRRCGKTVYPVEAISAGEDAYHKLCFKCHNDKCTVKLNLKTFKRDPQTGEIYCEKHLPKSKPTSVTDSVLTKHALNAPKKGTEAGVRRSDDKYHFDANAIGIKNARAAPKTNLASGVHKGDKVTAPKSSGDYANDKSIETGELESNPEASSADTGHSWGTGKTEAGEFESTPEKSTADTGHSWGTGKTEAGEFESHPEASHADSGHSWGANKIEAGEFENSPEKSNSPSGSTWGDQKIDVRGDD